MTDEDGRPMTGDGSPEPEARSQKSRDRRRMTDDG